MKKNYIVVNTVTTVTKKFTDGEEARKYIDNHQEQFLCLIDIEIDQYHNVQHLSGCMY